MTSDSKSAKDILAEHLCPRFGEVARMVKTEFADEQALLTDRICKKLADFALQMAEEPFPLWDDLRDELRNLTPEDFTVLYDLRENEDTEQALHLIEDAINAYEFPLGSYGQSEFSFEGNGIKDLIIDNRYETFLLSFDPELCIDLHRRYAACSVIMNLEFDLQNLSRRPGGSYGTNFGLIQVAHFPTFAYLINAVLDEYALPEDNMLQYIKFDEALSDEKKRQPQTPKP